MRTTGNRDALVSVKPLNIMEPQAHLPTPQHWPEFRLDRYPEPMESALASWGEFYAAIAGAGTLAGGVIAVLASRAILEDGSPGHRHRWDAQHIASFVFPLVIFAVGGMLNVMSLPAGLEILR
ncbi:hypothetical protein ABIE37_003683 [Arthrobacter bambusae]|uniref:Uncharacterized protein n=1 Tax=Arthrobacter bambusae TaxID=1338426 RepID=A0ABV2PAT0_9MICC